MAMPDLPTKLYSLEDLTFHTERRGLEASWKMLVTGVDEGTQTIVNPIRNAIRPSEGYEFTMGRYYASALGIDWDMRISGGQITLDPVGLVKEILSPDLYLEYPIVTSEGVHSTPIHLIPTLCFGCWGSRNRLWAVLPGLYEEPRTDSTVTYDEMKTFCEKGLRPSLQGLSGEHRAGMGPICVPFHEHPLVLPSSTLANLGESLRFHLAANNVSWGANLRILHEVRDGANDRRIPNRRDAMDSLNNFLSLNNILPDDLHSGLWYFDVAVDIASVKGESLFLVTENHREIVEELALIRHGQAKRLTTPGCHLYRRDFAGHLMEASGLRIFPDKDARGPFGVIYFEVSHHDDALDDGLLKKRSGQQILQDVRRNQVKLPDQLLRRALEGNKTSSIRFVLRVPYRQADKVLINIDKPRLRRRLLSFPRDVWWRFLIHRYAAFHHVLRLQLDGDPEKLPLPQTLLVTASMIWFINSFSTTLDLSFGSQDLLNAILPHAPRYTLIPEELVYPVPLEEYDLQVFEDRPAFMPEFDERREVLASFGDEDYEDPRNCVEDGTQVTEDTIPHCAWGLIFLREINDTVDSVSFSAAGPGIGAATFLRIFGMSYQRLLLELRGDATTATT